MACRNDRRRKARWRSSWLRRSCELTLRLRLRYIRRCCIGKIRSVRRMSPLDGNNLFGCPPESHTNEYNDDCPSLSAPFSDRQWRSVWGSGRGIVDRSLWWQTCDYGMGRRTVGRIHCCIPSIKYPVHHIGWKGCKIELILRSHDEFPNPCFILHPPQRFWSPSP